VLKLERIDTDRSDWARMDALPDRMVFQTRAWLDFLLRTQGGELVLAAVKDGSEDVGFFTGIAFRRLGVPILGSPFPGWTTGYMGFNLEEGVSRIEAARALPPFAHRELRCLHLELKDRRLGFGDLEPLGFSAGETTTYDLDLTAPEDEIFGRMASACRRNVRAAEKRGVAVEQAHDPGFADDYYEQLLDVFGKQELRPPYGVERVRELIRALEPTGNLLLLRARDPEGSCIATGIFPGFGRHAFFWGGASLREHQRLRPNEAIFWAAIREWKRRGAEVLDMGGGGDYKRKYGPEEHAVPWFRRARLPGMLVLRDAAERVLTRGRR